MRRYLEKRPEGAMPGRPCRRAWMRDQVHRDGSVAEVDRAGPDVLAFALDFIAGELLHHPADVGPESDDRARLRDAELVLEQKGRAVRPHVLCRLTGLLVARRALDGLDTDDAVHERRDLPRVLTIENRISVQVVAQQRCGAGRAIGKVRAAVFAVVEAVVHTAPA